MEPDAKYVLVGGVLIVLSVLFVGALLWVSNITDQSSIERYNIYFKNQSLAGLQVDSAVTMKGIKVGTVRDVKIVPRDIERVLVQIGLEAGSPVKVDTKAVIQRNLLTGIANIDLVGSTQEAKALLQPIKGQGLPIIPEGQTGLEAIQRTAPELLERTSLLVERVAQFLSPENKVSFEKVLNNLEAITGHASGDDNEIARALREVRQLAADMRVLVKNLDERSNQFAGSVNTAAQVLSHDSARLSKDIGLASRRIATTMESFEDPKTAFFGPEQSALGPGEGAER